MYPNYKEFQKLFESYPENPEEIVIKNEHYPTGLREKDVYNYYILNKKNILQETKGREIILLIFIDTNQYIVKRRGKNNSFIFITKSNYDKLITGRTVSLHNTMDRRENFGIIDIDYNDFKVCKEVSFEVFDFMKDEYPTRIRFTGKNSFHVVVDFEKNKNIDKIRNELFTKLNSKFSDKYLINANRSRRTPNLDLSSNKYRGGFIFPFSLSMVGLKCMEVDISRLDSFKKEHAKIRV